MRDRETCVVDMQNIMSHSVYATDAAREYQKSVWVLAELLYRNSLAARV